MRQLRYIPGTDPSQAFSLEGPRAWAQTAAGIRGRKWSYTLGYRDLTGVARAAREADLEVTYVNDRDMADLTRRLFDADVAARRPGTLEADGWATRVYVTAAEATDIRPALTVQKLTVAMLDGIWRKPMDTRSYIPAEEQEGADLDYPHDYPHDYLSAGTFQLAYNTLPTPMPFRMVIYGPVTDPRVTIGPNTYGLDMDIPAGGHVTIVSIPGQRSITYTSPAGETTNAFAKGIRGTGQDGGRYIFQPIPAGNTSVIWTGFRFDLTVYLEESEPPWSNS